MISRADYFRCLRSGIMASPWLQVSLLCGGSCCSKRRNVAMWLLGLVFTGGVDTPRIRAARYLRVNGSSRLIGPFKHGCMATALISIRPGQVPELIPVVDAWLAAP